MKAERSRRNGTDTRTVCSDRYRDRLERYRTDCRVDCDSELEPAAAREVEPVLVRPTRAQCERGVQAVWRQDAREETVCIASCECERRRTEVQLEPILGIA